MLALILACLAVDKPFAITVVDDATGRGVPLVELRTIHNVQLVTDSNGVAAFHEPGLMRSEVYFHVSSHGYEYAKDGFNNRGVKLMVRPGGSATVKIKRINLAERLYRVTGTGVYRDSLLVGRDVPIKRPVLNANVLGQDSVMNVQYRGKLYWFWGDTLVPSYPLASNYHMSGATSALPADGGLDPSRGVDLTYFTKPNGDPKPMCPMPGDGPTWAEGIVALPDETGRERLYACYDKIKPPLSVYARGLVVWDDDKEEFVAAGKLALDARVLLHGHPLQHGDHVYFAQPFPIRRCLANGKAFLDPAGYESWTCLKPGTRVADGGIERDADGKPLFAWKKDTEAVGPNECARLVSKGVLTRMEAVPPVTTDGRTLEMHRGSVSWNEYRKKWVMIAGERRGKKSELGEIWCLESERLTGPWVNAVQVLTHDKYSFYNPKQHPYFAADGGRTIYFEGTYTRDFSGNPVATPRYEYNQVMYRLDLSRRAK